MQECHNNIKGVCTISTYLTKHLVTVKADEATCTACTQCEKPKSINKVTCGVAIYYLRKIDKGSEAEMNQLTSCAVPELAEQLSGKNRPESALRSILKRIGIKEPADCICTEYATQMDLWGYHGCLSREKEIIAHLNSQQISWLDMVKVAANGYLTTKQLFLAAMRIAKP